MRPGLQTNIKLMGEFQVWRFALIGLFLILFAVFLFSTKLQPLPFVLVLAAQGLLVIGLIPRKIEITVAKEWHRQAVARAEQRQQKALDRFKQLIAKNLDHSNFESMTPALIISLALGVESEMKSPRISIVLIKEALRAMVVYVTEKYEGDKLDRRLRKLKSLWSDLMPEGGALLSIATASDPLSAYMLSVSEYTSRLSKLVWTRLFLVVGLITAVVVYLIRPAREVGLAFLVLLALFSIYTLWRWFLFALSGLRTRNFFSSGENGQDQHRHNRLYFPNKLSPILDPLSFITTTRSNYFHRWWSLWRAPVLEAPYLGYYSLTDIKGMHEYRYFKARPLRAKLNILHYRLLQLQKERHPLKQPDLDEYCSLGEQLWVITGSNEYQNLIKNSQKGVISDIDLTRRNMDLTEITDADISPLSFQKKLGPSTSDPRIDEFSAMFHEGVGSRERLGKRFEKLHRDLLLAELGQKEMPADDIEEYISLCNDLREITGSERYRHFEKKAKQLQNRKPRF